MFKKLLIAMSAAITTLFLVTACAEDATDAQTTHSPEPATETAQQDVGVMNQPVDFSSPEAVEKTLQNIRDKEGDTAYNQLKNAMQYIKVYDLSLGNSDEKLYRKLNGRTPEQIIAKIKR